MRMLKKFVLSLICSCLAVGIFSSCMQNEKLYKSCDISEMAEEYLLNGYRANKKWEGEDVGMLGYVSVISENALTITFAEKNIEVKAEINSWKLRQILLALEKNTFVSVEGKIQKIYSDGATVKIDIKTDNIKIIH